MSFKVKKKCIFITVISLSPSIHFVYNNIFILEMEFLCPAIFYGLRHFSFASVHHFIIAIAKMCVLLF